MPILKPVQNSLPLKKQVRGSLLATNPLLHDANHTKLLQWCKDKLDSDQTARGNRCSRYARIDKATSGWIKSRSDDDAERLELQEETGEPAVVKQNLSLIQLHVDDMAAYFVDIFAPTRGVYYALGDKSKMANANKMAALLSADAKKTRRVMEYNRFFANAMKYNLGGLHTHWHERLGTVIANDAEGKAQKLPNETLWEGNKVSSVDMYNFWYDSSVDVVDLYSEGEWCATAELKSYHHMYKMNSAGRYSNYGDLLDNRAAVDSAYDYYKSPPREADMDQQGNQSDANFSTMWAEGSTEKDSGGSVELVTMHAFLNPKVFGIAKDSKYQLYKIVIAAGKRVVALIEMNNIHERLPYTFARPLDDQMKGSQKSAAEILTPLQDFASFCFNIHSEAVRTGIYGTKVFNSAYIDVDSIPEGTANANIATKPGAKDVPINNIVTKLDSNVDTQQLMASMDTAFNLGDSMFPATQMPNQVAGIDRAVNSQVAAAVQGATKRLKNYGRVIVDQCMEPSKEMQVQNNQQFFKDSKVEDGAGETVVITAESLREEDVTTQIGHGLMTLDREKMVGDLRDILFAVIQSQAASQQIDVVALLGSMMDMMDYHLDVEQFRLKQEPQQGGQNVPDGSTQGDGVDGGSTAEVGAPSGQTPTA